MRPLRRRPRAPLFWCAMLPDEAAEIELLGPMYILEAAQMRDTYKNIGAGDAALIHAHDTDQAVAEARRILFSRRAQKARDELPRLFA